MKPKPASIHWSKHWVRAANRFARKLPQDSQLYREFQEAEVQARMKDDARVLGRFYDAVLACKQPELTTAIARALAPQRNLFPK